MLRSRGVTVKGFYEWILRVGDGEGGPNDGKVDVNISNDLFIDEMILYLQ